MSYYERNKEKAKEYNLKRYHNLDNEKKRELNDKRSIYYKQYYEETKTLKGKYNKSKTTNFFYKNEPATSCELDLYDIF